MHMTLTVTHRIELPPLFEQFLAAMLGQLSASGPLNPPARREPIADNSVHADTPARLETRMHETTAAVDTAVRAGLNMPAAETPPAAPVKKRAGRPSNAEKAAAAAAQSVPSVAPVAATVVPAAVEAQPAAAPANDPWAVGTTTAAPPAASLLTAQPPLATTATWDDVEKAFKELLFSTNGEAKLQALCGKYGVAAFDQLKPEQFNAIVSDMKAALHS